MSERGQAFTLEGVTASLLLVGGLVFALQATAVTPLSASASSQHIENQQQASGEGVLAAGVETGSLRVAVLSWDDTNGKFYGASQTYYVDQLPPNRFGDMLRRAFGSRNIITNVNIYYQEGNRRERQRLVYSGAPSDNAAAASTTITLYDDDPLYDSSGEPTTTTVAGASTFYAEDENPGTGVFNVIEVEVVVWRQ